jgi:hypothetical protein
MKWDIRISLALATLVVLFSTASAPTAEGETE